MKEQQILKIHKRFYDSLSNDDNKKILRIYGYNSPEEFLDRIIDKLNDEYNFLKINKFDFLSDKEKGEYCQYNGYISGNFTDYDLITVSFTTIVGKLGNVFLYQQVLPMITKKIQKNQKFLIDNRIKKICLLTTHKSKILSPDKNIIKDSKTDSMQVAIKYLNTVGFDVLDFFHVKNLSANFKYNNIDELMEHANYLQEKKSGNSQFQQIVKKNNLYYADFENEPKGQEIKFFALKLYAAIILLKGRNIDISNALEKTSNKTKPDITLRVMDGFIKYLQHTDLSIYDIFRDLSEETEKELEIDIEKITKKEVVVGKRDETLPCYKQEPIYSFNSKGKKVFKTQRRFKKKSFEKHNYYCACHEDKHFYFTAEATNMKYVEGHHMIPMEFQNQYWKDKQRNLDCAINLIPLCAHCHGKIHKSIKPERVQIITEVYNKYKEQLLTIDDKLTFDKFAELYNVYIY